MENYFFLILVAVVGLIRWLSQAAENKRNAEATKRNEPLAPSSTPAPARGAPQTEEERIRKFLEALGVPTVNTPPPRVEPRPITPQPAPANRKILPVDPFPVPRGRVFEPRPQPPVVVAPPPLPSVITPVAKIPPQPTPAPVSAITSGFEVHEIGANVPTQSDTRIATLAARLATPQGLREAMVLREIFGPPRSMQPLAHRAAV